MKNLNLLILLIFPALLQAQSLVIENAENFKNGTVLTFQKCEPDDITPQEKGENIIWDFTKLSDTEGEKLTEKIISPTETKYHNLFPDADLVEEYSDGRLVYFTITKDKNNLVGFVNPNSGIIMHYENPMLFMKRPITFGDSISDSYSTKYSVNNMDFIGKGIVSIIADGYGTLKLPNDKVYENVLRVKITQNQTDEMTQYPNKFEMTTTTYVWFGKENTSALLKINQIESQYYNDKTVEYLLSEE